jgi:hypothetical protein
LSRNASEFQEVKLSDIPKADEHERMILYVVGNAPPGNAVPTPRADPRQISRSSSKHEDTDIFRY